MEDTRCYTVRQLTNCLPLTFPSRELNPDIPDRIRWSQRPYILKENCILLESDGNPISYSDTDSRFVQLAAGMLPGPAEFACPSAARRTHVGFCFARWRYLWRFVGKGVLPFLAFDFATSITLQVRKTRYEIRMLASEQWEEWM